MNHMTPLQPSSRSGLRPILLIVLAFAFLVIMVVKAGTEGWFESRQPLDLAGEPALLFFNRHKGCECALVVYKAADQQIIQWQSADRLETQIIRIDLDRRPDLGEQFGVIRAPSLMFVDSKGLAVLRQDEPVSDAAPLNLALFEQTMTEYFYGK